MLAIAARAVQEVKRRLQDLGYLSVGFSRLPDDMSTGSRELLLALAWLLSAHQAVDHCFQLSTSVMDTHRLSLHKVVIFICNLKYFLQETVRYRAVMKIVVKESSLKKFLLYIDVRTCILKSKVD